MTDHQAMDIGQAIIELLGLTVKPNGRVDTQWGDKTPLGLYLTLRRFMNPEGGIND